MRIGLTYDLQDEYRADGLSEEETAEFDRADTIQAIEETLRGLGHLTDRIGSIRALTARLAAGDRWDLVFNIAEGLYGIGREAQVPALLDAFGIPYTFSDPLVLSLTLNKAMTKRVVRDLGIPTADFAVVDAPADIERITLPFPLFAKPVAEGTGKGISVNSRVEDRRELDRVCRELLDRFRQPVLVETFLSGREFTVGILGTGAKARVVGVLEIHLMGRAEKEAYSYLNKKHFEDRVRYLLCTDAEAAAAGETALAAWRGLGCRDGGRIDIRSDGRGIPHFIEVNPLAGIHPVISDLPILCRQAGIGYRDLLAAILTSALERVTPRAALAA